MRSESEIREVCELLRESIANFTNEEADGIAGANAAATLQALCWSLGDEPGTERIGNYDVTHDFGTAVEKALARRKSMAGCSP